MVNEIDDDLRSRKAIVIGGVGSGKTCLCRYVSGLYDITTESKLSGFSITKEPKMQRGKYIKVDTNCKTQFSLLDTEGYGSDEYSRDSLRNQLLENLRFETELNAVVIVVSMERFRAGLKDDLNHLMGVINSIGIPLENIVLCLTHCEIYTDAARDSYLKEFLSYYNLKLNTDRIIFGCFANISEINETYVPLIAESVKESINKLRSVLCSISTTVNVAVKIRSLEAAP